jgi:hypothetical protein
MSTALKIVQNYFPTVDRVVDGEQPLLVEVTQRDNRSAKVRNHQACAMAVACKRAMHADGVIVSVNTAYVINGTTATRYSLPQSVSREVVSFDRDAGFAPGEYMMSPPCPTRRLGAIKGSQTNTEKPKKRKPLKHHTSGIRTVLGSKGDV